MVCDEVGRADETLVYLNRIIELDSTYIAAYVNIGFKYQLMGNHEKAIKYFVNKPYKPTSVCYHEYEIEVIQEENEPNLKVQIRYYAAYCDGVAIDNIQVIMPLILHQL